MTVLKPSHVVGRTVRPFDFASRIAEPIITAQANIDQQMSSAGDANPTHPVGTAEAPQTEYIADQRFALTQRVAELEEEAAKTASLVENARKEGVEEGRKLGRAEAETSDQERLKLLREALGKTHSDIQGAIAAKTELAVEIARATLARILGDQSAFAAMIAETASYWSARLADTTIVRLRVSGKDFPDPAPMNRLSQNMSNIEIQLDEALDHGACIFELKLGELDASIPLQADRAERTLKHHGLSGTVS